MKPIAATVGAANIMAPDYQNPQSRDVGFTRQQIEHLERLFPEMLEGNASEASLRHRIGQRSVIAYMRTKAQ